MNQSLTLILANNTTIQIDPTLLLPHSQNLHTHMLTTPTLPFPLPKTTPKTVYTLLTYCTHKKENPSPCRLPLPMPVPSRLQDLIDSWDLQFLNRLPHGQLLALINCAQELGVEELVELGCAQVAMLMRGMDAVEILRQFGGDLEVYQQEQQRFRIQQQWRSAN